MSIDRGVGPPCICMVLELAESIQYCGRGGMWMAWMFQVLALDPFSGSGSGSGPMYQSAIAMIMLQNKHPQSQ